MNEFPSSTPNVRIEDPNARRVIGNVFGYAGLTISAIGIVDAAIPAIDLLWLTAPASTIVLGLFGLFQTTVTSQNVPRTGGKYGVEE